MHVSPHRDNDDEDEIHLAAIEGGGTTFVVSVARVVKHGQQHHRFVDTDDDDNNCHALLEIGPTSLEILHTASFPPKDAITGCIPTWTPTQIVDAVCGFLIEHRPPQPPSSSSRATNNDKSSTDDAAAFTAPTTGRYSAAGIATFGPAGVHPHKPNYGTILSGSPKKEWRNVDILTPIREACGFGSCNSSICNMPSSSLGMDSSSSCCSRVRFDTDVNAPALAEFRHRCHLQQQQQQEQEPSERHQHRQALQSCHKAPPPLSSTTPTTPLTSLAYITIGTGVGVGLIINSAPVHGLLHPEGGHVAICPLEQQQDDTTFTGYSWGKERSPYGGVNTVEGVASSVALTERFIQMNDAGKDDDDDDDDTHNIDNGTGNNRHNNTTILRNSNSAQTRELLSTLPDSHTIWSHAANAIANLCVSLLLLTSVQKIVLGGGIMKRTALFPMIRQRVWTILNGYLDCVQELSDVQKLDNVIVEGCWIQQNNLGSGLVGAYALALDAYYGEDNCKK